MSYWPGKAPAHDRTAETKKGPEGPFFYHYSTLLNAVAPYLERETRLELATPTLARSCSTN